MLELQECFSIQLASIHLYFIKQLVGNIVELFTAFIDLFLAYESPDRNCLRARFYDLNIDSKLLMYLFLYHHVTEKISVGRNSFLTSNSMFNYVQMALFYTALTCKDFRVVLS